MKESYWGYWLILLGILVVVILLLVQNYTTTNTQDYYLLKETTDAAMADAVDYAYYKENEELRINKEVFMESFIKRFAENASLSQDYKIQFYDIYEAPPKVSVKVTSSSRTYSINGTANKLDSVNKISSVLQISPEKVENK